MIMRRMKRWALRRTLLNDFSFGAWVAHLPAFLDRGPRSDLHRARKAAFMRGFRQEQALRRAAS